MCELYTLENIYPLDIDISIDYINVRSHRAQYPAERGLTLDLLLSQQAE